MSFRVGRQYLRSKMSKRTCISLVTIISSMVAIEPAASHECNIKFNVSGFYKELEGFSVLRELRLLALLEQPLRYDGKKQYPVKAVVSRLEVLSGTQNTLVYGSGRMSIFATVSFLNIHQWEGLHRLFRNMHSTYLLRCRSCAISARVRLIRDLLSKKVDGVSLVDALRSEYDRGRRLLVGITNAKTGAPAVVDVTAIAKARGANTLSCITAVIAAAGERWPADQLIRIDTAYWTDAEITISPLVPIVQQLWLGQPKGDESFRSIEVHVLNERLLSASPEGHPKASLTSRVDTIKRTAITRASIKQLENVTDGSVLSSFDVNMP